MALRQARLAASPFTSLRLSLIRRARGRRVASYCPTCRGLLRPQGGALVCIRCAQQGRARTVLAGGKRIHLAQGQQGLGTLVPTSSSGGGVEPTLQPTEPHWRPANVDAKPHPQLALFPYDTIRDGQKRFTRDVTMAVQGGKHLVAQAPTGIGKTAAALAPALQAALEQKKTVLFLTSRQSQHRIAVETLRIVADRRGVRFTLVDLVSKRDMCLRPEASDMHAGRFGDFCAMETRTKSCQYLGEVDNDTLGKVRGGVLHVEELMAVSKGAHLCPHMVALEAAKGAQVIVADYNHLFSDLRESSLERLGLTLAECIAIVDEAHNLPDRIRGSHSHRITPYLLDQVDQEARGQREKAVEADLAALRVALQAMADKAQGDGRAKEDRMGSETRLLATLDVEELPAAFEAARNKGMFSTHRTLADAVEALLELGKKVRKGTDTVVHSEELMEALEDWARFRTGGLRYLEWEPGAVTLHVRLLDPALPARTVFQRVHSAILMSGTLRPPEMVRDLLGLDAARTAVRSYPSPFPQENRLVVVGQGYTTRYSGRGPEMWTRMADCIRQVCRAAKGNVAVFAPSYAILRDVRASLDSDVVEDNRSHAQHGVRETIVEEPGWLKGDRDRVLDTLEGARKRGGAILLGVLGGSFSEGVDFKDNLLSAVVIVGLPLAPPDLEVEAGISYLETRHPGKGRAYGYTYPAMSKVLQAMGRGIRSSTDRCVIVLLDERYMQPPYRQMLPDEAIVVASREPAQAAAQFLARHGL
jgi:DNA excision repair protein ERCC-2